MLLPQGPVSLCWLILKLELVVREANVHNQRGSTAILTPTTPIGMLRSARYINLEADAIFMTQQRVTTQLFITSKALVHLYLSYIILVEL